MKNIRLRKKLTLKQLSKMTGVSSTYLNDLENLKCCSPNYKIMQRITKALNISVEDLEEEN